MNEEFEEWWKTQRTGKSAQSAAWEAWNAATAAERERAAGIAEARGNQCREKARQAWCGEVAGPYYSGARMAEQIAAAIRERER